MISEEDITIDRQSSVTAVAQLAEQLGERIRDGRYAPGEKIPSEAELVDQTGLVRRTIRDAIALLVAGGLVERQHGRGVFVREYRYVTRHPLWSLLCEYDLLHAPLDDPSRSLWHEITGTSVPLDVATTYVMLPEAPADVAEAFGRPDEPCPVLRRQYLFVVDGKPHALSWSYLPWEITRGTPLTDPANERKDRGTMAQLHSIGCKVAVAETLLRLHHPSPDQIRMLAITPGTPTLRVRTWLLDARREPLAVSDLVVPADRVDLQFAVDLRTGRVIGGPGS